MSAGKGDKWRKDFDYSKYWTNYESLSAEEKVGKIKPAKKDHSVNTKRLTNGGTRYIYK